MIPQHDRGWCITVRTVPAHYDALLSIKLHICVNANVWHSAARDDIGQLIDQTIKQQSKVVTQTPTNLFMKKTDPPPQKKKEEENISM